MGFFIGEVGIGYARFCVNIGVEEKGAIIREGIGIRVGEVSGS